jgi:DNA-binding response OmpR family regulator
MAEKILVVDDDAGLRDLAVQILKKAGFSVDDAESAEEALQELRHTIFDLIILDLQLPGISGIKACEIIKQDPQTARIPIIMLTSNASEKSKVQGLETGADDYIVKPPSPAELVARVNALLRRVKYQGLPDKILKVGEIELNKDTHEVTVKGKPVSLRPMEFDILALLLEKKGRVLSRSFLFQTLWADQVVTEHTLEVHINHLRDKLGAFASNIQTVSGVGYKFQESIVGKK